MANRCRGTTLVAIVGAIGLAPLARASGAQDSIGGDGGNGANGGARLALTVAACPWQEGTIQRIIAIELGEDGLEARPTAGTSTASPGDQISIRCEGMTVAISVRASAPPRETERHLRLDDVPPAAAARTIALAGVELLASINPAIRQRLDQRLVLRAAADADADEVNSAGPRSLAAPVNPTVRAPAPNPTLRTPPPNQSGGVRPVSRGAATTPAPPPGSPFTVPVSAPPAPRSGTTILTVVGTWRTFAVTGGGSFWGGGMIGDRMTERAGRPFLLTLDLDAGTAQRTVPIGGVRAVLLSAGGWLGMPVGSTTRTATIALGFRLGMVRMSGVPADPAQSNGHVLWRPWTGPAISARGFWGGRVGVDVGLELGMSVLGAQGTINGDTTLATRGLWFAAKVGFAAKTNKE